MKHNNVKIDFNLTHRTYNYIDFRPNVQFVENIKLQPSLAKHIYTKEKIIELENSKFKIAPLQYVYQR